MGLGPPVCERCRVIGRFNTTQGWHCPVCNNRNMQMSLFDCKISKEELEGNMHFYNFVKGKSS